MSAGLWSKLGRAVGITAGIIGLLCLAPGVRAQNKMSFLGMNYGQPAAGYALTTGWNQAQVTAAMQDLKAHHMNICRVWLFKGFQGIQQAPAPNGSLTITPAALANVEAFVTTANSYGITVELTFFDAWDFISYNGSGVPPIVNKNPGSYFNNPSLYSVGGPIYQVAQGLAGKMVYYDFCNEINNLAVYYNNSLGAFQDVPGVTGANGLTGWQAANDWLYKAKSSIRMAGSLGQFTSTVNDPGIFLFHTYTTLGADGTPSSQGDNQVSDDLSQDALNRDNLDFYDVHVYDDNGKIATYSASGVPGGGSPVGPTTVTYGGDGKPWILGEFGPNNSTSTWANTPDNVSTLVDNFYASAQQQGFQGMLMWEYQNDGDGWACAGSTQLAELGANSATAGVGVWTPLRFGVGSDGSTQILWSSTGTTDQISMANAQGQQTSRFGLAAPSAPNSPYVAQGMAVNPKGNGSTILWTNSTDNSALVWEISALAPFPHAEIGLPTEAGWYQKDIAYSSTGNLQVFWLSNSELLSSIWPYLGTNPLGGYNVGSTQSNELPVYCTVDQNNINRYLLDSTDGTSCLISHNSSGSFATDHQFQIHGYYLAYFGISNYPAVLGGRTVNGAWHWTLATFNQSTNVNNTIDLGPQTNWFPVGIASTSNDANLRILWQSNIGQGAQLQIVNLIGGGWDEALPTPWSK